MKTFPNTGVISSTFLQKDLMNSVTSPKGFSCTDAKDQHFIIHKLG